MKPFRHAFLTVLFITLGAIGLTTPIGAAHPSIDIVASNWKFTPDTISVTAGEQVTLRLTSSEGVHGLASKELGIPDTTIMPNKEVAVTFTPSKPGTYVVHCSVVCGAGHANMALTIKVTK